MCPFCPGVGLDPLGHHCVTCRHGGDVVWRHNLLREAITSWAVETFGHWGKEAQSVLSMLASHLSISLSQPRAAVVADIYGRLNIIDF